MASAKLSTIILLVLIVPLILGAWGILITDFEQNYVNNSVVDVEPVNSSFKKTYDKSDELEEQYRPLQDKFQDTDEEEGFFDRLSDSGLAAIPVAIVKLPGIVFDSVKFITSDFLGILKTIGIPKEMIYIGVSGFFIFIVFKLVEFWRRYEA